MSAPNAAPGMVSGEGVVLELTRAGLGSRTIAALIDMLLQLAGLLLLLVIDANLSVDGAAAGAIVLVEVVAVLAGYPIVFEWLSRGRTLGKMALGLRVVRDDGGPIGLRQATVRGISGLVLEKPGLIPILTLPLGMTVLGLSSASKRIGDSMAGTFVLNERVGTRARALSPPELIVPHGLEGWAATLDLTRLDDGLALSARQFIMRAGQLTFAAREQLAAELANRVLAVTAPPPPYGVPAAAVLVTVLAERRRRAQAYQLQTFQPQAYQPQTYQPQAYPPPGYQPQPAYGPPPPAPPPGPFVPPS